MWTSITIIQNDSNILDKCNKLSYIHNFQPKIIIIIFIIISSIIGVQRYNVIKIIFNYFLSF